ncbi:hypothetical protein SY83_21320 [Paenibacillus swuensis]|uniref:Aminoglycoside phosphotransferase domain-containing protein n=1 Tax=Paenibacillus swuensis TaxID=1178515 RepID=A0A172TNK2_9BACL|nr:phosphotransferase [Paenibacillus swuensis]ANE48397.1 hypothetical protein SY83_21320 [Paenibacillus swuensis]
MEQEVEVLFGEHILNEAASRFGLTRGSWSKLGDFENYVYEADRQNTPTILRLTHSSHRSLAEVISELDWIAFLSSSGMENEIAGFIPSLNGLSAEKIQAGSSYFIACLFHKAPGVRPDPNNPAQYNTHLFKTWGAVTGRMHRISQLYSPETNGVQPRLAWDEDVMITGAGAFIPAEDIIVGERLQMLISKLRDLPQVAGSYGLIHSDIHSGNFFTDEGRITVFDFDDAMNTWFIHDVAIPLYYSVSRGAPANYGEDRSAFARVYFKAFWEGYSEEFTLSPAWLDVLPLFLQLRDIILYLVLRKKRDVESMPERLKTWYTEIRERIIHGQTLVDLDFRALAAEGAATT